MDQAEKLALTPEQEKAVKKLEFALAACAKAGVYLWDNYGSGYIHAVNGKHLIRVATDSGGERITNANITAVKAKCWNGSNSDDPIYADWR